MNRIGANTAIHSVSALAASRVLDSLVTGVVAANLWTCAVTAAVLVTTALATSYIPARRAAKLDPL